MDEEEVNGQKNDLKTIAIKGKPTISTIASKKSVGSITNTETEDKFPDLINFKITPGKTNRKRYKLNKILEYFSHIVL